MASTDPRRWRPASATVAALVIGLVLTGALTWAAYSDNDHNEQRLLHLQVRQVATATSASLSSLQSPLVAAAEVASATNGNVVELRGVLAPEVGPHRRFTSVSLWDEPAGQSPRLVAVVGAPPALARHPAEQQRFLEALRPSRSFTVTRIIPGPTPRIGIAEVPPGTARGFLVYAEASLPRNRRFHLPRGSAFGDLAYAAYLGRPSEHQLIAASAPLPLPGRHSKAVVPFGNTTITLVATPLQPLGGTLSQDLPWIIGTVGVVGSVGGAVATQWLVRRRRAAERLARENAELYREQRGIAETLQRALLPAELPQGPSLQVAARYRPGVETVDVGGDWYDVIRLDDSRCFFMVGDVSGRGLAAATTMASLRYAARAFVAEGHGPAEVVCRLRELLEVGAEGRFATMVCGQFDARRQRMTLVNAGHPAPLMVNGADLAFVEAAISPPVGVPTVAPDAGVEVPVPPGGTLLAYTDGLVERRGEDPITSRERLRHVVTDEHGSLDQLLESVLSALAPEGGEDDIAVLALRWGQPAAMHPTRDAPAGVVAANGPADAGAAEEKEEKEGAR